MIRQLPSKQVQLPGPLFSSAISTSPVSTMTLMGALVGAAAGGLTGSTLGMVLGKTLALKGAAVGAALMGARGYVSGKELSTWLRQQT